MVHPSLMMRRMDSSISRYRRLLAPHHWQQQQQQGLQLARRAPCPACLRLPLQQLLQRPQDSQQCLSPPQAPPPPAAAVVHHQWPGREGWRRSPLMGPPSLQRKVRKRARQQRLLVVPPPPPQQQQQQQQQQRPLSSSWVACRVTGRPSLSKRSRQQLRPLQQLRPAPSNGRAAVAWAVRRKTCSCRCRPNGLHLPARPPPLQQHLQDLMQDLIAWRLRDLYSMTSAWGPGQRRRPPQRQLRLRLAAGTAAAAAMWLGRPVWVLGQQALQEGRDPPHVQH
jgi:hypothetical protein